MLAAGDVVTLELGQYRLRECLASSSYGVIWRAGGPRATRDVALKLVNADQMAQAAPSQRAHWIDAAGNEIAFLRSLEAWDERHIVRLLDSGTHQGLPVLALELLERDLGRHMATLQARGATPPLTRVLDWIGQLNQALAKVHQYGWRHLDLKPANILLDPHLNSVKLADFGTSRPLTDRAAHGYAGSANWQAPEQFFPLPQGGYASDARSDYFALGALFYFLVCGRPLRFCSACGHAYRQHGAPEAAQALLRRHGGTAPPTLDQEEEARFVRCVRDGCAPPTSDEERERRANAARDLLRALLAPAPAGRPGHAVHISRMLAAIDDRHGAPACVPGMAVPHSLARPAAHNGWPLLAGMARC